MPAGPPLIPQESRKSEEDQLAQVMAVADVGLPCIGDPVYQIMVHRYRVCIEPQPSSITSHVQRFTNIVKQ